MLIEAPAPSCASARPVLPVDHIGVVVHDLAAEVAAWRRAGFVVSDPVALMGTDTAGKPVPLGQSSAHVVFENAYVELSSPVAGSGNHLEPYLALGEGVRILVVATDDAEAARVRLLSRWPELAPVRLASRAVAVAGRIAPAEFRWFSLAQDIVPGVLSAVVEHRNRDLVLHRDLSRHPNGLRRMTGVHAVLPADERQPFPLAISGDAPTLFVAESAGVPSITGVTLAPVGAPERFFRLT